MKRSSLFVLIGILLQSLVVSVAAVSAQEMQDSSDSVPAVEEDIQTSETDEQTPRPYAPLRPRTICPTDAESLTALMIRDLPGYTNRVLQRTSAVLPWTEADELRASAGELVRQPYRPSHVLTAGQADLAPLALDEYTYTTDASAGGPLTQVFFTTLSRQYSGPRFEEVQAYHWLFLAQATDGWRLAFMFSSVDNAQTARAPLPPYESSRSSVGQAAQLWLRDCRAGATEAVEPMTDSK